MRILITNDDGIHAEGIIALEKIAREISDDVWIVAPESEQSGVSHSLTLRRPLRIHEYNRQKFSVDGTPTDCVLVAIKKIMQNNPPNLILSGINHGSNMAEDVTYSGTVSAAMEATLLGIPAIALSQRLDFDKKYCFNVPLNYACDIIKKIYKAGIPHNTLMNVNFPWCETNDIKGVKIVPHGKRKISDNLHDYKDPSGKQCYWIGFARSDAEGELENDLKIVSENYISITPISMDLTNYKAIVHFKGIYNDW